MSRIEEIFGKLMEATYKESSDMNDAVIEDFMVNLNPFLRPAHFLKARDAMAKGDEEAAFAHTIQANPFLPALPTGLIDVMRKKNGGSMLPDMPELP